MNERRQPTQHHNTTTTTVIINNKMTSNSSALPLAAASLGGVSDAIDAPRNEPAPVLLKVRAAHNPEWLKRPARQQVSEFDELK
jgi:hypothetical protein